MKKKKKYASKKKFVILEINNKEMANQISYNLLNYEENRLRTFIYWPQTAPVDPERLARAGFFSTHNALETQCFACDMKISNWEFGDQVSYLFSMKSVCFLNLKFVGNGKTCTNERRLSFYTFAKRMSKCSNCVTTL